MATSSILKDFVIEGDDQVNKFIDALEQSAKNRPVRKPVNAVELKDDALWEFMKEWERNYV